MIKEGKEKQNKHNTVEINPFQYCPKILEHAPDTVKKKQYIQNKCINSLQIQTMWIPLH